MIGATHRGDPAHIGYELFWDRDLIFYGRLCAHLECPRMGSLRAHGGMRRYFCDDCWEWQTSRMVVRTCRCRGHDVIQRWLCGYFSWHRRFIQAQEVLECLSSDRR